MKLPENLHQALRQAEKLYGRTQIEVAISRMGTELDRLLDGEQAVFISVMQGAVVFAGALALAVRSPLEFDYVHATRYLGNTTGGELQWRQSPQIALQGRTIILADDILDEGHTLVAIREWCLTHGARKVLIAVLCIKRHGRCVPGLQADSIGLEVPDRYVFGYGMDFREQGRNLPAIYALPGDEL